MSDDRQEAATDIDRDMGAVAWIDVEADSEGPSDATLAAQAVTFVLRRIERAVRADDRVCPVSTQSVVVQFGTVASVVPPSVLGNRLAHAIGPNLPFNRSDANLAIAIGMAAPLSAGGNATGVTARARLAARSARRTLGLTSRVAQHGLVDNVTSTAVVVDEPVEGRASTSVAVGRTFVPMHRRTAHRFSASRIDGIPVLVATDGSGDKGSRLDSLRVSSLCVLVVDPMAAGSGIPGFPSLTATSVAERLGCRTGTANVAPYTPLVMTVGDMAIDLVVLVLDGAWVGRSPDWASGAWGFPARVTSAYLDKGIPVFAVSAGAGAGAIAACVSQGALALFNLEQLSDALRSLDGLSFEEARLRADAGFPVRFHALLGLTTGERRVLFYLTEGWAAQDIAEELVVSLTTVRSHIRSVLRKLGVRSQLAAVAIANSRDLEHHKVTANS